MTGYLITMACGHTGYHKTPVAAGTWLSCWAVMHPERGCQTQRKVVNATAMNESAQGVLW